MKFKNYPCCECCKKGCSSNPKDNHFAPCSYCQIDEIMSEQK